MPDFRDSTPPAPDDNVRPAAEHEPSPDSTWDRVAATQRTLLDLASRLRIVDQELALASTSLPEPTEGFSRLTELQGAIDCVRQDLLLDAIETLETAGRTTQAQLRLRFLERHRLLVV